jgi:hypothetical protein
MKNGIGLKIGMAGIVLVPLPLCIFNNHNPSKYSHKQRLMQLQFIHPFAIVIGDCDIGSLVFVAYCYIEPYLQLEDSPSNIAKLISSTDLIWERMQESMKS